MELPIACTLPPGALADRRAAWKALTARALREQHEIEAGVRLVYAGEDGVEAALRELVRLEEECCAFAQWQVESEGDDVVLSVLASGEGVAALRAMFADA